MYQPELNVLSYLFGLQQEQTETAKIILCLKIQPISMDV